MDQYVKVYLWQGDVTQLPVPKHKSVRPTVFPIVRRVVESAVASAFNPVELLRHLLQRHSGDLVVNVLKRVYTL